MIWSAWLSEQSDSMEVTVITKWWIFAIMPILKHCIITNWLWSQNNSHIFSVCILNLNLLIDLAFTLRQISLKKIKTWLCLIIRLPTNPNLYKNVNSTLNSYIFKFTIYITKIFIKLIIIRLRIFVFTLYISNSTLRFLYFFTFNP